MYPIRLKTGERRAVFHASPGRNWETYPGLYLFMLAALSQFNCFHLGRRKADKTLSKKNPDRFPEAAGYYQGIIQAWICSAKIFCRKAAYFLCASKIVILQD